MNIKETRLLFNLPLARKSKLVIEVPFNVKKSKGASDNNDASLRAWAFSRSMPFGVLDAVEETMNKELVLSGIGGLVGSA